MHHQIITENLARVREQIQQALQAAGRDENTLQMVAVTKYVDAALTAQLHAAGCQALGESRPQQLCSKATELDLPRDAWHLIGHLQRNKVRAVLPHTGLIHSVDSPRLLQAINTHATQRGVPQRVLLEVNCSGDQAKHGLSAAALPRLLPELVNYPAVQVCGLMTMAAREGDEYVASQNFALLRKLRDELTPQCPPTVQLAELSMGMSRDFPIAIREGATIVRIGSLLYAGLPGH